MIFIDLLHSAANSLTQITLSHIMLWNDDTTGIVTIRENVEIEARLSEQ